MRNRIYNTVLAAVMLALCWLMPFLMGFNLPALLKAISPMHIPVFLCGFLCGMPWAAIVGFIAPISRSLLFGVPALMPTALAMAFELCAYGTITAILSARLPRRILSVYLTLICAMIVGRLVGGAASAVLNGLNGNEYSMKIFVTSYFVNAWPAIVCHILIIPPIVLALSKSGILHKTRGLEAIQ